MTSGVLMFDKKDPAAFDLQGLDVRVVKDNFTDVLREQLINFWLKNGAIQDRHEAIRRTSEVICLAFDDESQIAGVSSVYPTRIGQDIYLQYRTYTRKDCRIYGLMNKLYLQTVKYLQAQADQNRIKEKGMLVVTENPKFNTPAGEKLLREGGLEKVGLDQRKLPVWKLDF